MHSNWNLDIAILRRHMSLTLLWVQTVEAYGFVMAEHFLSGGMILSVFCVVTDKVHIDVIPRLGDQRTMAREQAYVEQHFYGWLERRQDVYSTG
jgi:hypothetical protein